MQSFQNILGSLAVLSLAISSSVGAAVINPQDTQATASIGLYSDEGCANKIQTFTLGNINECHTASQAFYSFEITSNGISAQTSILAYASTDCTGIGTGSGFCLGTAENLQSFQLVQN